MAERRFYFIHNDKKYESGTVVVLYNDYFKNTYERVFLCHMLYDDGHEAILYMEKKGSPLYSFKVEEFYNILVEAKDEICEPIRDSFLKSTGGYNSKKTWNFFRDNPVGAQGLFYLFLIVICVACPPLGILVILFALIFGK